MKKGLKTLVLTYTSESSIPLITTLRETLYTLSPHLNLYTIRNDVSSSAAPTELVSQLKDAGITQLDIIIHNAGVSGNDALGSGGVTAEEFDRQYYTNVRGPLMLQQALIPLLPRDGSGRIVGLSSVSASEGFVQQSIYGGTKAAMNAMVRTWARELVGRATVNAVNPGPVGTDMYSGTTEEFKEHLRPWVERAPGMTQGRNGAAEEIAGVIGMLCLPESAWCNGCIVGANGGMVMSG